jgi:hypothetical protein
MRSGDDAEAPMIPGVKMRVQIPVKVVDALLVTYGRRDLERMVKHARRIGPARLRFTSNYDKKFKYRLGGTVEARGGDGPGIHEGCGEGIHFFADIGSAITYVATIDTPRIQTIPQLVAPLS